MHDTSNSSVGSAEPLSPWYARSPSTSPPRATCVDRSPRETSNGIHWPPRELLYVKRYVKLKDYVQKFHSGQLARMSTPEKFRRYGSPIVPIFVPLAHGESIDEYEERFVEWLEKRKGLTLESVQSDPNPNAERNEWYEFAHLNAKGLEKYDPIKSSRKRARSIDSGEPPAKRAKRESSQKETASLTVVDKTTHNANACKMVLPPENAPRTEVIAAYVACGCQRCLLKGIWHMARKVSEVETKISAQSKCSCGEIIKRPKTVVAGFEMVGKDDGLRSPQPTQPTVPTLRPTSARRSTSKEAAAITRLLLSRPSPADLVALASSATIRGDAVQVEEDPVEKQLASQYDEINEQVIMNENVLEASAARLASTPVTDIEETTRLQDENLELRGFVQEEVDNRNAALAMLVVYLWRHDRGSLEKMMSESGVSNVVHVQRMGHQKCDSLAKQIAAKREVATNIKSQLDAAMDSVDDDCQRFARMAEFGGMLGAAESDIKTLRSQRQREFATLVHFDDHLRLVIKTLLEITTLPSVITNDDTKMELH